MASLPHHILKFDPAEIKELSTALGKGLSVKVTGLGIFEIKRKPVHNYRHPKTGELCQAPAKLKVVFRASKSLMK